MRIRRGRAAAVMMAVAAGCGGTGRPATGAGPAVEVRLVSDEARAALAILEMRRSARPVPAEAWDRLLASEGYRRLKRRETAMGRGLADSAFRVFLLADTLAARAPALAATLAAWEAADVGAAARRAHAYLPEGARLRARVYPMIKPQTNSFVFDTGTDSAAIFLYLDPAVPAPKLENTLAHELHHVGYAAACTAAADQSGPEGVRTARAWLGAFGEGLAMLAAAGGANAHPHAVSDPQERAVWDRDFAKVGEDLPRIEAFLLDVANGRMTDPAAVRRRAMTFFGEAQGPWYTVGYLMAATVERAYGRARLVEVTCDRVRLLSLYNAAAAQAGTGLPRWSDELLTRLSP